MGPTPTAPQGPLAEMSVPLRDMSVARFAGLGVDPGAPLGSLRVALQVRPAGARCFSNVQLDPARGLLCVESDAPVARLRVAVPPGTFMLKFFADGAPLQTAPSTGALGVNLGPSASVAVQAADGVVRLASPFRMSARVDWGRTNQLVATPVVSAADEFRLVPDFALAYSMGGRSAWDWTVFASASELLGSGYAALDSPTALVTAPARPATLLRAWLLWAAVTAILMLALAAGLGLGWGLSASRVSYRPGAARGRGASSPGDAVAVRRTADGGLYDEIE